MLQGHIYKWGKRPLRAPGNQGAPWSDIGKIYLQRSSQSQTYLLISWKQKLKVFKLESTHWVFVKCWVLQAHKKCRYDINKRLIVQCRELINRMLWDLNELKWVIIERAHFEHIPGCIYIYILFYIVCVCVCAQALPWLKHGGERIHVSLMSTDALLFQDEERDSLTHFWWWGLHSSTPLQSSPRSKWTDQMNNLAHGILLRYI